MSKDRVAAITEMQATLVGKHPDVVLRDRVDRGRSRNHDGGAIARSAGGPRPWDEQRQQVGRIAFPAEMGANAGQWIGDRAGAIAEPATEFAAARTLAYRNSQECRMRWRRRYTQVFQTGAIDEALRGRRARKLAAGHVNAAPSPGREQR